VGRREGIFPGTTVHWDIVWLWGVLGPCTVLNSGLPNEQTVGKFFKLSSHRLCFPNSEPVQYQTKIIYGVAIRSLTRKSLLYLFSTLPTPKRVYSKSFMSHSALSKGRLCQQSSDIPCLEKYYTSTRQEILAEVSFDLDSNRDRCKRF